MIGEINNNQIQAPSDKPLAGQNNYNKTNLDNDADLSLQVNYASYIKQANQIQTTDNTAVQNAKQLLASGQLDNPENIHRAAEELITFGI